MTAIAKQIRDLNLPADQFVVIGSGVLDVHGIRKAADVDLVASPSLWNSLQSSDGWQRGSLPNGRAKLMHGEVVEAYGQWEQWSFDELRQDADEIDGILFADLNKVREFKVWRGLEKDMADVQLIDEYLKNRQHER